MSGLILFEFQGSPGGKGPAGKGQGRDAEAQARRNKYRERRHSQSPQKANSHFPKLTGPSFIS